jgi:choline dehydrogenase-like flavoprotein
MGKQFMTTSHQTPFLAEVLNASEVPEEHLEYFRSRLKMRLYSMIQNVFRSLQSEKGFSKAMLAKRLGKDPALITRWMNSPGNLEVSTISDLLLAMGREPILGVQDLEQGAIAPSKEAWLMRNPGLSIDYGAEEKLATLANGRVGVVETLLNKAAQPTVTYQNQEFFSENPMILKNSALAKASELGHQDSEVGLSIPNAVFANKFSENRV